MEVDHFDPRPSPNRNRYKNLFWSTGLCNNNKSNTWPSPREVALGIRFLDCTAESDYGPHIVEELATGRLVGVTPAGKYHLRVLGLNDPPFVEERLERTRLRKIMSMFVIAKRDLSELAPLIHSLVSLLREQLQREIDISIPELPPLTG